MAEEYREAEVARDPETGRVTGYVERVERPRKKRGSGMLLGLLLGAMVVAGGVAIFASNQGGYAQAGATVDQELAQAEETGREAAADASVAVGAAAESAGDAAEQAGENVQTSLN